MRNQDDRIYSMCCSNSFKVSSLTVKGLGLLLVVCALWSSSSAFAQFSTVLNIPPDPVPATVASDTLLRILPSGVIGDNFSFGSNDGLVSNVLMNVSGGSVGRSLTVAGGARLEISDGSIDRGLRVEGGVAIVSGGTVFGRMIIIGGGSAEIAGGEVIHSTFGGLEVFDGFLEVTGGIIGESFRILQSTSAVNISGGRFDHRFQVFDGSVNLFGDDYRLDGVPITGLDTVGSILQFDLPPAATLSGTLADGTTFSLNSLNVYESDMISPGTLSLNTVTLPNIVQTEFNVTDANAPLGARIGQTVNIAPGGILAKYFSAAPGSEVNLQGGMIDHGFEAVGAEVNISSGNMGVMIAMANSRVMVTGGTVHSLTVTTGTTATITGGSVQEGINATHGGEVFLDNGVVKGFAVSNGGKLQVTGGVVTFGSVALSGGELRISGGELDSLLTVSDGARLDLSAGSLMGSLSALNGSELNITGLDFFLDGVPIAGLVLGQPMEITSTQGTLSGHLADGTAFEFDITRQCARCSLDGIDPGATLTATLVAIPEPASFAILFIFSVLVFLSPQSRAIKR